MAADVTVIGAGLAGLSCARHLSARGLQVDVLEASDAAGGRVRTDAYEGFLLDRGFQVILAAYPECDAALDYKKLELRAFFPGALMWFDGKFHKFADPWRRPFSGLASLASGVGSFADKVRIASFREHLAGMSVEAIFAQPEATAVATLHARHFTADVINRFFRPFLSGIFLGSGLQTSRRMFDFVFKMFSEGDTALPAGGIGAIPKQLAWGLPIQFGRRVVRLEELDSKAVVIATEGPEAARLSGTESKATGNGVRCFYFAADKPPIQEPILILNGENEGPVNNFAVVSEVSPSYAPAGASLLSASVLSDASEAEVRAHMASWFGSEVKRWTHLRTYDIAYAQPSQNAGRLTDVKPPIRLNKGLYVCGDHIENASLDGALRSGRRAAEAVLQDLA